MAAAAPAKKRGRGGLRLIVVLVVIVLIVVGLLVGLSVAASAATNVGATLTVFVPSISIERAGGGYAPATSGAVVEPGDSVKTDAKGRGEIRFPDGTLMRLATNTEISLTNSHFAKDGNVHDISILEKAGRTLSEVQHLVGGATFQVVGNTTTASVRGTKFEVLVHADASVVIKLFEGGLDVDGKSGHVHINAGQQVTIAPDGTIGTPGPIQPDPNDPFSEDLKADQQVETDTTPGTEQDYTGGLLHNGEEQQFTYSFAGGSDIKAALAYPGSLMKLQIEAPDGHDYSSTGPSPIVITVPDPPPGIYKIDAIGISGLNPDGEVPYVSVAAVEPCQTSDISQNGAVRKSFTGPALAASVQVQGLSNLSINVLGQFIAGAILQGGASYNGVPLTGTVLLYAHGGNLGLIPVAATAFGVNIPAQQAAQQIGSALGQDPANIGVGFHIDRLFTCQGVVMIDGRS
ncbi:MAG TPA: FecR family protein [Candidatus Dormibacteraeota bacterium]|nr:FecR family protein [Candidatus Dormibacteraeota bacterium]